MAAAAAAALAASKVAAIELGVSLLGGVVAVAVSEEDAVSVCVSVAMIANGNEGGVKGGVVVVVVDSEAVKCVVYSVKDTVRLFTASSTSLNIQLTSSSLMI